MKKKTEQRTNEQYFETLLFEMVVGTFAEN